MKTFLSSILSLVLGTAFAAPPVTVKVEQNPGGLLYRNYVKNPGAEQNVTYGITNSSSIVTRSTSSPIEGVAQFSIDATATSQNVDWATNTMQQGLKNGACEARWTISGDASLYTASVLINSVVVATTTLTSYSDPKIVSLGYPCGDLTNPTILRIASTGNGAAILVDSVYAGLVTNISKANIVSDWQTYTLTIGATTTAPTPGTSTSLAKWRRDGGDMLITYYFSQPGSGTAGSGTYLFPIPSGYAIDTNKVQATTDTIGTIGTAVGFGQASNTTSAVSTTAGTMTLFVRNSTNLYAVHANTGGQLNPIGSSEISIGGTAYFAFSARVPIVGWSPETSVATDQVNTDWAAYTPTITGFGTATGVNFKSRREGSFLEVIGTFTSGTVPAATTGSVTIGFAGVNANVTADINVIPAASSSQMTQVGTFTNSSQADTITVLTEGSTSLLKFGSNQSSLGTTPITSTGVLGNTKQGYINARIPITGWTATQTYYIPGSVSSNSTGQERMERAIITNNGSACTATSQTGSWITSITRSGTGLCDITVAAGIFSAEPTCQVTARLLDGRTGSTPRNGQTNSSTSVKVAMFNGNTATYNDADFNITCMGPR
jgi:hypothetical protein